jgi:hypothetical protein
MFVFSMFVFSMLVFLRFLLSTCLFSAIISSSEESNEMFGIGSLSWLDSKRSISGDVIFGVCFSVFDFRTFLVDGNGSKLRVRAAEVTVWFSRDLKTFSMV